MACCLGLMMSTSCSTIPSQCRLKPGVLLDKQAEIDPAQMRLATYGSAIDGAVLTANCPHWAMQ
jgi:hypothetical protein